MKALLIIGPDSTLRDAWQVAREAHAGRTVEMLPVPSRDYYDFDLEALRDFPPAQWQVFVAVNEFYINDVRRALYQRIVALGYDTVSIVSPGASVDHRASIGANCIIYPGCFVGADSRIGDCCVLRPNVVIGEDTMIADYVTLEANVSLREGCRIGAFTTVCANSSLMRMTEVGAHCYLNLPRQYSGQIPECSFYSPAFENPIRVLSG